MKKIHLVLFFLFAFTSLNAQWFSYFNTGNDMNSIHFVDLNTGWAVGANNTIIKTTNGGDNWFTLSSGLPFTTNFNSVFFYDEQNGFIACDPNSGNSIVIKTTNGGNNWQALNLPVSNYKLTDINFHFVNDSNYIGFVCGYDTTANLGVILKTTDLGLSWTQKYNNSGRIKCLNMHSLLMGIAGGETLLKTQDGGENWTVLPSSCNINDFYFLNQTLGWICTESGKVYKTNTAGESWNEQFQNNNVPLISIFFNNSANGWVTSKDGKIYKTTNAGNSWVRQITSVNTKLNGIGMISNSYGFSIGSGGLILKTDNGGGSFSTFTNTFTHNNINKPLLPNLTTLDTISVDLNPYEEYISVVDIDIFIDTVLNIVDSNLIFVLTHNNIKDTLIYKAGLTGNNFIGTVLDDDANKPIEEGKAPFTGSYKPFRPLSALNYTQLGGDWVLSIYHSGEETQNPLLTGVIKSWGMAITYNKPVQLITGHVNGTNTTVASGFKLSQNFPNPFNPVTRIQYSVPKTSFVSLVVYDIIGREIEILVNKEMNPGNYTASFDGSKYGTGIYFYKLTTKDFSETRKMVLVK